MKRTLAFTFALFALTACAGTTVTGASATAAALRTEGVGVRLVLLDAQSAGQEINWALYADATQGENHDRDRAVRAQCGAELEPPRELVSVSQLAGLFLKPVVAYFVGRIDKAIQAELQAYVAGYSASTFTQSFYAATDPDLELGWTCFRFTRTVAVDAAPVVALDLIGQLRLSEDRGALLVRPLRLYLAQAKAKGKTVGLAISLKSESVWRDAATRKSEKSFDLVLIKEARASAAPSVRYYLSQHDADTAGFVPVKLPPWTRRTAHSGATGNLTLTLTVAEAGNAPTHLKAIAEIFSDKQDDLSKLIVKALEPVLGL